MPFALMMASVKSGSGISRSHIGAYRLVPRGLKVGLISTNSGHLQCEGLSAPADLMKVWAVKINSLGCNLMYFRCLL